MPREGCLMQNEGQDAQPWRQCSFKCEGQIEFCSLRDEGLRGRHALGFTDPAATQASGGAAGGLADPTAPISGT